MTEPASKPKFYLMADPEDGLPPIKQEISAERHAAMTAFEDMSPSVVEVKGEQA